MVPHHRQIATVTVASNQEHKNIARFGMTRPKILLFEHARDTRDAMRASLENENCDVVSPGTIDDALGQIFAQDFDVLIIDLRTRQAGDRPLVTAMRTFQPGSLLVAVSDSLDIQEFTLATHLQVDFIVGSSDMKDVAELIYTEVPCLKSSRSSEVRAWFADTSRSLA
jgi:DNA-binding NtrC family response regulator